MLRQQLEELQQSKEALAFDKDTEVGQLEELVKGLEDEVAAAQRELSVSSSALDGLQAEKQ